MEAFWTGDSYLTPERSRRLGDRLALGTRGYFLARYARVVVESRRLALDGKYDGDEWARSSLRIVRLIEACGGRFRITGLDNLRLNPGPLVFVANHMSTLETQVLPSLLMPSHDVVFVVKDSLLTMPFFGTVLGARRPIAVHRRNPREDLKTVLEEGAARLAAGQSVIIFPQSTRSPVFDPLLFNSLGHKLAQRAGVKLLPIALKTDFWETGRLLKDLGPLRRSRPVNFAFGAALDASGRDAHEKTVDFIRGKLGEWGKEEAGQAGRAAARPDEKFRPGA